MPEIHDPPELQPFQIDYESLTRDWATPADPAELQPLTTLTIRTTAPVIAHAPSISYDIAAARRRERTRPRHYGECEWVDRRSGMFCDREMTDRTVVYIEHLETAQTWCRYHASNYATVCTSCREFTADFSSTDCGRDACSTYTGEEDEGDGEDNNYDGDRCTDSCCNPVSPGRATVHDYYYRPTPVFYGDGPTFMGFELEMETGPDREQSTGRALLDVFDANATTRDLAYLKHDGSISYGFEMVTHPMSYNWAIDNFPFDVLDLAKRRRARAADSCGLHIHVNRDGFSSPTHVYRWLKFIYRNERGVTAIARRRSSSWARFHASERALAKRVAKPNLPERASLAARRFAAIREDRDTWLWGPVGSESRTYGDYLPGRSRSTYPRSAEYNRLYEAAQTEAERSGYGDGPQRYSAVNTTNANTFEMRVFASTLDKQELGAALGLASASVEYTRHLTSRQIIRDDGWSWGAFRTWVNDRPDYAPLTAEMSKLCVS